MSLTVVGTLTASRYYRGLSSDAKPTDGVVLGSIYYESDTYRIFEFDGTAWLIPVKPTDAQQTNVLLEQLLEKQDAIIELLGVITEQLD